MSDAARLRCARIAIAIDCTRCARPIPLAAVTGAVRCRACGHVIRLGAADWRYLAARAVANRGPRERSTDFAARFVIVSRTGTEAPTCAGCGAAIAPDALAAACGGTFRCACGVALDVRAPDARVRAIRADAVAIAGEREGSAAAPAPVAPVAFRCPACGGGVATDGVARTIGCRCGADVDVPDPLWDAIHPVIARPAIWLVYGGAEVRA